MFLTERSLENVKLARITYPDIDDPLIKLQYTLYVKATCELYGGLEPFKLYLTVYSDKMMFDSTDKKTLYSYLLENSMVTEVKEIKEVSRAEYMEGIKKHETNKSFRNG